MKAATLKELENFFKTSESEYNVLVPIELHDGTRSLGKITDGPLALTRGLIPQKTTSIFFPQRETMFTIGIDNNFIVPEPPEKPIMVVGLTAEDAECLEFIDKFFSTDYRDDIYFKKRDNSVVFVISGKCGKNGEFLKISGGKCDIELVCDGDKYIVVPYTEKGNELEKHLICSTRVDSLEALHKESDALPTNEKDILLEASKLIAQDRVPEEFWDEIANRCIACTGCNLVCPTCTCFHVGDLNFEGIVVRERIWDSCQLDGFMREASGHNPMGIEGQRTRRRIHHKLVADLDRWGHVTCFLCGRCDEVCPTNIGIKSVTKEIVDRFGQK